MYFKFLIATSTYGKRTISFGVCPFWMAVKEGIYQVCIDTVISFNSYLNVVFFNFYKD